MQNRISSRIAQSSIILRSLSFVLFLKIRCLFSATISACFQSAQNPKTKYHVIFHIPFKHTHRYICLNDWIGTGATTSFWHSIFQYYQLAPYTLSFNIDEGALTLWNTFHLVYSYSINSELKTVAQKERYFILLNVTSDEHWAQQSFPFYEAYGKDYIFNYG